MTSTAPIPGPAPETTPVLPVQAPKAQAQQAQATASANANQGISQAPAPQVDDNAADLRLVIEDDKAAGSYVYVTINSVTGKVVSQIPREQLLKMREDPGYKPGSVIDKRS
jgi:flagellar protein FlaG